MKKKQIKKRDPIAYNLLTSGLYKQRIVQDKKKKTKKFSLRKELSYYLSTLFNKIFK